MPVDQPPRVSIQELDTNLQEPAGGSSENHLNWVDGRTFTVEGLGWSSDSEPYCRFPDQSEPVLRGALWTLSRCSAGVCIRFISNTDRLSVRWSLRDEALAMSHMPATSVSGLDLYIRDPRSQQIRWAAAGRPVAFPDNISHLLKDQPDEMREYFLYLPLYNGVTQLEIGFNPQAEISPAPPRRLKALCFYGASIVQGACVSRPGLALPALLGRRFERAVWNFGFSGNSHAEPEVATLLAQLNPAVYVVGPAPSLKENFIAERVEHFLQILRHAHPKTPIVFVGNAKYQDAWTSPARHLETEAANVALRRAYEVLREGITDLHFVAGEGTLGDDGEATVDGIHPNDLGFWRLAEAIAPKLNELVSESC